MFKMLYIVFACLFLFGCSGTVEANLSSKPDDGNVVEATTEKYYLLSCPGGLGKIKIKNWTYSNHAKIKNWTYSNYASGYTEFTLLDGSKVWTNKKCVINDIIK